MQFLTSLFGEGNTLATMALALGIVVLLIVLVLWALKMLFNASGTVGRGRNRRLSIVDTLPLDARRQLLIVRRDNVEHLLLMGGPQDVVIETGIPVETTPVRVPVRRPTAPVPGQKLPRPRVAGGTDVPELRPGEKKPLEPRPEESPAAALARLREGIHPLPERRPPSLRHTGLMRTVSRMEAATALPENSPYPGADSAKEARGEPIGKGNGDTSKGAPREEGRKADGQ